MAGSVESRALRNGFRVPCDERSAEPRMVVSHAKVWRFRQGRGGNWIKLATARFDGVLEVLDADLLKRALVKGIGHGKGFGCGLLTLAPMVDR